MGRRGTETRQKTRAVLVRLTPADHERLAALAQASAVTEAEYLRRRIGEPVAYAPREDASAPFSETDRVLLSAVSRAMGHLAGILKRAVFELPPFARSAGIRSAFEDHSAELKELQLQLRAFLDRR